MTDSSGKTTINSLKGPFIALILVVVAYYGWVGLTERERSGSESQPQADATDPQANDQNPASQPNNAQETRPQVEDPTADVTAMLQQPEVTQSNTIPPVYEPSVENVPGTAVSSIGPASAIDPTSAIDSNTATRSAQFESTFIQVQQKIERGELSEALTQLSSWYDSPGLSEDQTRRMLYLLDGLGYSVIFSQKHLLEIPYRVAEGETLQSIAVNHDISWELLAAINQIGDTSQMYVGQPLKVVNGPFDAVIDLSDRYLTLKLKGRYATRFPIDIDSGQFSPPAGTYFVSVRFVNPLQPDDGHWIGLKSKSEDFMAESRIGLHGIDHYTKREPGESWASVRLDESQIHDLFIILAEGSSIVVRK